MNYLFQMSDAELERAREAYDRELYRMYYGVDEDYDPHCCDCTHYCGGQCERYDDDDNEYYVDVNDDDDPCDDFEQREEDQEPPDNFDYFEYTERKKRLYDE